MATLYITEFTTLASVGGPGLAVQGGQTPPVAQQTVAIGGSSTPSTAFNVNTKFVRLHTDAICSVEFGAAPTATAAKARLAANQTEYFGVIGGQKVAVITNS